jgi:hypothetical protein
MSNRGKGLRRFKKEGVQSAIIVPFVTRIKYWGAFQLGSRAGGKFQADRSAF